MNRNFTNSLFWNIYNSLQAMEFYENISKSYDYIFPANPAQVNFIFSVTNNSNLKILDIGCATGSLALALAEKNISVWAFDYDAEMVKLATEKKQKLKPTGFPVFDQLDMRKIDSKYKAGSFDQVVCFGNTLVHLLSNDDISSVLKAVHTVLRENGKIIIQILNYDYILSEKINSLPLIENEHIRFERYYEFPGNSKLINFKTVLTEKETNNTISNTVLLNPLLKSELEELLVKAGFQKHKFFGSFQSEELLEKSFQLIVVAEKETKYKN